MTAKAIEIPISLGTVMPFEQLDRFIDLVGATNKEKPKRADVDALRRFLKDFPQVWQVAGNLGYLAYIGLLDNAVATAFQKESLLTGYKQLQNELARDSDGELEKLLIQQVTLAWFRLQLMEHKLTAVTNGSHSMREGEYAEKRLSAAQRRFLRASETLVRVRRLNLPAIQVNIGQQQVNQVNG